MRRTISTPPSSSGRTTSLRAGRTQLPGAVPRRRARDDAQMRRALARGRHHRQRRRVVGQRDDERAGALEPGVLQDFGAAGVAVQHRHAELVQLVRPRRIGFDDEPRNPEPAERLGDVPSDAPAADDHDVIA